MAEANTSEAHSTMSDLYNPLAIDLQTTIQQFQATCVSRDSPLPAAIDLSLLQQYLNQPDSVQQSKVLDQLSQCLCYPPWTRPMVSLFRPIIIDLVARWTMPGFTTSLETTSTVHKIELVAKAFSVLLPVVPQVKSLAVSYFTNSPSLFERLNHLPHDITNIPYDMATDLQDLLLTTYRLLSFSSSTFVPLWNWGSLVQLLKASNATLRYLTILCLSKAYQLSDLQTSNLCKAVSRTPDSMDEDNTEEEPLMAVVDGQNIDLRMLQLWEQQKLADAQIALVQNTYNDTKHTIDDSALCPLTSNLCGVLLPKTMTAAAEDNVSDGPCYHPELVLTETTIRNLHTLSLALSIGAPTLLEGVTGAGKTAIVEELASRTGRGDQLIKIHLGDQTDPKVLLGTYVSTSTPGSFRWQPGVLTTAVQEGRWVLIEDIDLAPAEVISVLLPLLETRQLFIPSRGEKIQAKEGFQLFGTRSYVPSRSGKAFSARGGDMVTGANLWTRVNVDPLSMEELETVVRTKFSYIGNFAVHVMRLFKAVISIYQDPNFSSLSSSTMGRFISTRDLMKWCHRINALLGEKLGGDAAIEASLDITIRQDLFSEAIDCFCGMVPDYATWVVILERVGEPLQISPEMVRNYVDQYKPTLRQSENAIAIGRVNLSSIAYSGLQKQKKALLKRGHRRPFATTGHALRLLEKISVCVHLNEPTLLVGETGTGKTTVVQQLADMLHQNLVVVNLSQQSDSSDLLGGFKPVEGRILAMPLKETFDTLFERTFSVKKNQKFLEMVRKTFVHQKWKNFAALLQQSVKMAEQKFGNEQSGKPSSPQLRSAWKTFQKRLEEFDIQQVQAQNKFVFSFMEGALVKAVRRGDWILLDEINLATTETLECLSGLLQDAQGSLLLTEKGDVEPIKRHPNFRLFACMNPATDVGKRDLPPGLRNRFTEFYVHPPDSRYEDLLQIVRRYLSSVCTGDERACDDVAEFYLEAKKLSQEHKLVDGSNQRPHFSMRTLSRALTYVVQIHPTYGLRRSLYEGFCMTFMTQLSKESEAVMRQLIHKTILRGVKNPTHLISQIPRQPSDDFIQFGYFWLQQGQFEPQDDGHYILTPSVETNLYNLARVIMSRKFPVLIQGPTSAGKTSMIEFLAKKTGHRFVRINNHEHTDLQEYLGTYVSDNDGKLVFQEGVLVEALRNGYWIVLDELNLAPSDVLEALNRLLDDNRELLIPETQEVVKPHPHFMLFATQNPAGLYGGRKALSRAFRNRFLELHFDDIPQDELETILSKRCQIAPSYCKKLVQVYRSLMEHRKSSRLFEQKHSFITLRDLFRWAGRDPNGYQELAEHGYMLLAERCRKDEEKKVVKQVLEDVMRVKLSEEQMYDCERLEEFAIYDRILREKAGGDDINLVWTKAMRRLFSLVARCLRYKEPVLLVGETGCGKTTVCQMLAETFNRELHIVNCHQNTETGDLLGGQRPVRNRDANSEQLFEWHDGPLVQAMRGGHLFLLDEISLADDSVLERLNSVLEPSRLLVLAEKGGKHVEELYGQEGFQFLATMNPGGDYGKKELSPALRNRFTEIWVPSVTDREDLTMIIDGQLTDHPDLKGYGARMLDFIHWFTQALGQTRTVVSLRDILSWVRFINASVDSGLNPDLAFVHGGCLVLLDGLGSHGASGSFLSGNTLNDFRLKCLKQLSNRHDATSEVEILGDAKTNVELSGDQFGIGSFRIERGPMDKANIKFTLLAPTTADNAMRVVRAMQLKKPILLEGSPGVGKTSLVSALAAASGHRLVRINLSEQTDLMDLFGSDLPVEGGDSGEFAWRDAPFLQAMKAGDWVLLDELNLASQSVLEGLNSCLDHRGAVYIPELDREFFCAKGFRVFGAQNPLQQGGGRKGLPKSFVNRFTQVYVEHLSADDLLFICGHLFPQFEALTLKQMIEFNTQMYRETMVLCRFGRKGSPWEFNLRDVFRWLELMQKDNATDPAEYLGTIYLQRMRTQEDRDKVIELYEQVFNTQYNRPKFPPYEISTQALRVGHSHLPRLAQKSKNDTMDGESHMLHSFLGPMEALMKCVESSWMAIVTGPSASGKTSMVRLLGKLTGNKLEEFAMNNSVDTMELLGGFEQVDLNRHRHVVMETLDILTNRITCALLMYHVNVSDEQRAAALQSICQINDAWFTLKTKHALHQDSKDGLDYTLLSCLVENLNNAAKVVDHDALSLIESAVEAAKTLQQLEKASVAGKFEWIDGLLINALEQGHWLLIDNANLCNPSVLDRLNPLFENDGVLMVNERGLVDGHVKVIKPHPNFRMFMTVDPSNGELSRAMRNRGIEIALVDANWNANIQDVVKLTNGIGIRGARLPILLNDLQQEAKSVTRRRNQSVREYLMLATYIVERLQRGQSLKSAVRESFHQVFVDITEIPETLKGLFDAIQEEDILREMLSPSNCPYFVGGSFFEHDSALATVALQGAYATYLLQQQAQHPDVIPSTQSLDVAWDYFIESASASDIDLRLRWLTFMAEHASIADPAMLERTAYILRATRNHPAFQDRILPTEHATLIKIRQLLARLYKLEHQDAALAKSTMRLKVGSMTALQQSYCFVDNRLSEAQLLHPIVKLILPIFMAIRKAFAEWMNSKSYENADEKTIDVLVKILDARDHAWDIAHSHRLSLDNYLNILRVIQELIQNNEFSHFAAVSTLVDEAMAGFDFETSRSMKALWKHFCPATLATEKLYNVEQALTTINDTLNPYKPGEDDESKSMDMVLQTKSATKETIIEGVATLYAVDNNDDKDASKLAKSMVHLPELVKRQVDSDQEAVSVVNRTAWDTALVPIFDHASALSEMDLVTAFYLLSSYTSNEETRTQLLEKIGAFRRFVLDKSTRPPLDLVPYQRILWMLDSEFNEKSRTTLPGMTHDATHVWHQRLWRSSIFFNALYQLEPSFTPVKLSYDGGPAILYQAVQTLTCLNILSFVEKMSALAYRSALGQLKSLKQFLATNIMYQDKKALELVMIISIAYQLLVASSEVLKEDIYDLLTKQFERLLIFAHALAQRNMYSKDDQGVYDDVMTTMKDISQSGESAGFNQYYVRAISSLEDAIEQYRRKDVDTFFMAAGKSRALLGLAFIAAYIPDYPVDPTAEPRLRVNLLAQKQQLLEVSIEARQKIEDITTGNDTNAIIDEEQAQLKEINGALAASATVFSLRPEKSQLEDIFVDFAYLQKHLVADNADSLLETLMDSQANDTALQRESLIQGNALQFIDRIHAKYPMYRDITQPLVVAVDDVKYGLRMVSMRCKKNLADEFLSDVVQLFIRSPDAARRLDLDWVTLAQPAQLAKLKAVVFERAETSRKWALYLGILIVVLQRLVMSIDSHGRISLEDLACLNGLFEEIVSIWKSAQEYKRQKEAEKEQMYKTRTKKYEPTTEEEQDEMDMKKTFADFNEMFADLQEQADDDVPSSTSAHLPNQVEEESVLDNSDVWYIGKLHRIIFDTYQIDRLERTNQSWDREVSRSYRTASQLSSMVSYAFDSQVDAACGAGHLRATAWAIQRLEAESSFSKTSDDLYDFYTCENVKEAKRVEPIVTRFKERIKEIQQEWPEHVVLQHLIDICDRLLSFSILSPVSKFLTGIELLLQKSEDWEAYAAKHVSLRVQREELTALIVSWRQLELNCWPKLLAAQEQYSQNSAFEWWFHLYDTVHNTSFDAVDDKEQKIRDLLMTLDQFFQSCSIIEFEPRLKMLDSFYRQAQMQAELTGDQDQWTMATILRNVSLYYSQFTSYVNTTLAQLRKPIEKELKDFVKIASWKDVNIYALKQSAQKTHLQLHKCIRKYREVLGTSMLTVIANYNQEHAMFQYGDDKRYNDTNTGFVEQLGRAEFWTRKDTKVPQVEFSWQPDTSATAAVVVKRHLVDLQGTLNKMRRYCREDLVSTENTEGDVPLESFMSEVIQQIKTFQKETPLTMTDENKSFVKNQKLLKKKALVDFLKELRRLGLKARPGSMADRNGNTAYLFNQHVAGMDTIKSTESGFVSEIVELWTKANDYYYKSLARLTHLRTLSTTQVSKDLSMLEVERAMSATEHMFMMVTKERGVASRFEQRLQMLQGAVVQLAVFTRGTPSTDPVDTALGARLISHKMFVDDLVQMVGEGIKTLSIQSEFVGQHTQQAMMLMQDTARQLREIQRHVDTCFVERYLVAHNAKALLTADIGDMMDTQINTITTTLRTELRHVMDQVPEMTHVIHAILHAIDDHQPLLADVDGDIQIDAHPADLRNKIHSLIDAILVSVQDLVKSKQKPKMQIDQDNDHDHDSTDMADNYIVDEHANQFTDVQALHLETVARRCMDVFEMAHQLLSTDHSVDAIKLLQQAYPFLQQYALLVDHTLGSFLVHHKAMAKMTYALVNSFTVIISKGFCMPQGADEEGEEGDADGMTMGTGIGEGEGTKDVSEEIEDEEQVLGTQNEEQQQQQEKGDTKEEKKGIDMENDFEGELEDIEQDEEQQEENEDDEDEEEEDIDDQIGDVDDMDPDAVDDKMWGDDEAQDERKDSDKTVDQQGKSDQQESDVVAKEDEEQEDDSSKPQPDREGEEPDQKESDKQDNVDEEEQGDEGDKDQGEGENEDDEGADENKAGEQMNVDVPEAETLELPEDLDMEGDQNEGEEQLQDPMDMDQDESMQDQGGEEDVGENEEEEQEQFKDALDQLGEADKEEQEQDDEMADTTAHVNNEEQQEDEEKEKEEEEDDEEKHDQTGDGEKGGNIEEDEEQPEEQGGAQNREQPTAEEESADNQFGIQGQTGRMSTTTGGGQQGENDESEAADLDKEQPESKENQGMAEQGANKADEDAKREEEAETNESKTNPQRSLGDALEDWRRRLADIADAEEEEEEDEQAAPQDSTEAKVNEDQAFEYVKHDEEAHDMQTMGNALPDQLQDIQMGAMDETTEDENQHAGEMDVDEDDEKKEEQSNIDTMPLPEERMDIDGERENRGGAVVTKRLGEMEAIDESHSLTVDESLVAHEPLDPEQIEQMRQELETTVSEWREEGRDSHQARELWQRYETLTHDLAMGLCEQLRLILEPTLATKLKGDYRTGKRLNMKKIIPYIASQFKKDKIWLRRTKPSKRQYQVMISVDDSKSMSESHSVQLAYETLSLISKALSQLEVGDISITSFGERVRLLHPFDQPFTSESGASVLQQFTFAQQKTQVKELIESSLSLFEAAKSSSNQELWQLQLIISDGICEDHDTLMRLVRRAMDEQVMLIFIVVDNKPEKDSILKMTNVKYATVNGKLTLQMRPYLETFPFQYFMVLRDINALPEALSDALRQYFSFVSA